MKYCLLFACLTLFAVPASAEDYPVEAIWNAAQDFCNSPESQPAGWVQFEPKADTVLDYLRRPSPVGSDSDAPIYVIYSGVIDGRKLFAMKGAFESERPTWPYRWHQCTVYDFEMQDKIDLGRWSKIAGSVREASDQYHRQRIDWGSGLLGRSGRIELRYKGWSAPMDGIAHLGLILSFNEREKI
jgi:hypothetical protein